MVRIAALLLVLAPAAAFAQAPAAPAAATAQAAAYSVNTTIGELLDNPDTKAVLNKYIPQVVANPQIDMGRPFPLTGIVQYVPELTPQLLAQIDADLSKVQKK